MKKTVIIWDAITAFILSAGGTMGTALVVHGPDSFKSPIAWGLATFFAAVAAAKQIRAQMSLPPLSNGQLDGLKTLMGRLSDLEQEAASKKGVAPGPPAP